MQQKIKNILNKEELLLIKKLNNPDKIQNFLDSLPFNFEKRGHTYASPRRLLLNKTAHCFEGAIFASLCFAYHGIPNFLVDLKVKKSAKSDSDHVVCVFKLNGYWGAISKTNHSVLRFRDPIYKNIRELALSYFHEYFLSNGLKTLESYSTPFNIWSKFGTSWVVAEEDLDKVAEALDRAKHFNLVPKINQKMIRRASKTEIKGAAVTEWPKS